MGIKTGPGMLLRPNKYATLVVVTPPALLEWFLPYILSLLINLKGCAANPGYFKGKI